MRGSSSTLRGHEPGVLRWRRPALPPAQCGSVLRGAALPPDGRLTDAARPSRLRLAAPPPRAPPRLHPAGKIFLSAGDTQLIFLAHVPKALQAEKGVTAAEWVEALTKPLAAAEVRTPLPARKGGGGDLAAARRGAGASLPPPPLHGLLPIAAGAATPTSPRCKLAHTLTHSPARSLTLPPARPPASPLCSR